MKQYQTVVYRPMLLAWRGMYSEVLLCFVMITQGSSLTDRYMCTSNWMAGHYWRQIKGNWITYWESPPEPGWELKHTVLQTSHLANALILSGFQNSPAGISNVYFSTWGRDLKFRWSTSEGFSCILILFCYAPYRISKPPGYTGKDILQHQGRRCHCLSFGSSHWAWSSLMHVLAFYFHLHCYSSLLPP